MDQRIDQSEPVCIDGCDTLTTLFLARCRERGDRIAHREKTLGLWRGSSWNDFLDNAREIGLGLVELGLRRGDVVSILSEDNRQWIYTDLAVQCVGGIANGIYPTDSPEQVAFLLADSGTRFVFIENDEQLDKFLEIRDRVPDVRACIVFERDGLHGLDDPGIMFLDDLCRLGRDAHRDHPERFEQAAAAARPEDTAILVYTSGTTGAPKGAMLSHRNILFSLSSALDVLPVGTEDEQLCFLPLCHVLERLLSVFVPVATGSVVNFAESTETVFDNLREVSPTVFTGVPRIWEKIHSRVAMTVGEATPIGRWAYGRALACGHRRADCLLEGRPVPFLLELHYRAWDWLVLANLRRMIGLDRAQRITTGAAPISEDLVRWYWAIGLVMLEGYGQTESSGILSVNLPGANRVGSVGRVVPGIELRISPEGELLARGPLVFQGYWRKPEQTADTIRDGWLHTGDIGRVDNQGFYWISGRIKDIIITAGGKNITPSEIENQLKLSPYITDAMIVGDRRPYLTALVMIDQENVERFAQQTRTPFSDFPSLCAAAPVQDLIRDEVETVNDRFAQVEQIKDFRVIDVLLTAEDDELTPTMKLRRGLVERIHRDLVEQMY